MPPKTRAGQSMPESSASKRGQKRPLKRRDTEDCISRILQLHFASWTHHDIHVTVRAGETLSQRLLRLKRERSAGERISAAVIADLRREYAPAHTPLKKLKVINADQPVEPGYKRLLLAADQNNPAKKAAAREELLAHLAGKARTNQREVVGLLRLCSTLNPATSTNVRHFLLAVARYLARVHAETRYPNDVAILRNLFDSALAGEYSAARKSGMTTMQFWHGYREAASLIGPLNDLEHLVYYQGEWREEKLRLKRVTSRNLLGLRMFSHALEDTLLDDFSLKIDQRMQALDDDILTTEAVKTMKVWERMPNDHLPI